MNPNHLRVFYQRLFPYDAMFEWLAYSTSSSSSSSSSNDGSEDARAERDYFFRREFSFTLANDVYIRYQSFRDANEFREAVRETQPHKIDIGAVCNVPARDHKATTKFSHVERELVFDVDLTDYEEVQIGSRKGEGLWSRQAWLFMSTAIRVVDASLREDFGFEHLLWVFSGRRGVHCWVCDARARHLTDEERTAIVRYLTVLGGKANAAAPAPPPPAAAADPATTATTPMEQDDNETEKEFTNVPLAIDQMRLTTPLHPAVARALATCTPVFETMVLPFENGQGLLATPARWRRVLQMIPDVDNLRARLNDEWMRSHPDDTSLSQVRWRQLRETVKHAAKESKRSTTDHNRLMRSLDAIVLLHTYPRLDVNVSTHRNHLLKSPFCVHPKTGKVCVPILDVSKAHEFDPDGVPKLSELVSDIDAAYDGMSESDAAVKRARSDAAVTRLGPYLSAFESQFLVPLKRASRVAKRPAQEARAAVTGEW